jgi:hypothetical protein
VAEPPELFRLKCVMIAIQLTLTQTHFKRNNPLVCRVSARYNHGSTGLKQVYLARRRVYNPSIAHQLLQTQTYEYYYKPCSNWKKNLYNQCLTRQAKQLVQAHSGRKSTRDYTRREGWHHARPKAWCHSGGSLPAGDGSHSMDQPKGTDVGHAGLSVGLSKAIPEKDTSKTEYSNTHQGLPGLGIL